MHNAQSYIGAEKLESDIFQINNLILITKVIVVPTIFINNLLSFLKSNALTGESYLPFLG